MQNAHIATALRTVMSISKTARLRGIRLVPAPRTADDDIDGLNYELTVQRAGIEDTGLYVQIGFGIATLNRMDHEGEHELAKMETFGANPTIDFIDKVVEIVLAKG